MYYIIYNGQKFGPMPAGELVNYGLNPDSEVWTEGMPNWVKAFEVPELAPYISRPMSAPAQPNAQYNNGYQNGYNGGYNNNGYNNAPVSSDVNQKKIIFAILAFLFGWLGIQYFYIGKVGGGLLCILLSLVTCGAWDFLIFIQAIMVLVMSDQDFDRKFLQSNSTMPLF